MPHESIYMKWRALIALAHTDGKIAQEEKHFLVEHIEKLDLQTIDHKQKMQLIADFAEPQDVAELFPLITDKLELLDFLRLAYFLFWSDEHFDSRERRMFAELREAVVTKMNISQQVVDDIISMKGEQKSLRDILVEDMAKHY